MIFFVPVEQSLLFLPKLENVLNYSVLESGSVTRIICNTSWSGIMLCISDMKSGKIPSFSRRKSGENIRQDMYEPYSKCLCDANLR